MPLHPSHKTRFSWDASTFDEICELCGNTDMVPGGWGKLADPCPANPNWNETIGEDQRVQPGADQGGPAGVQEG